MFQTTNQICFYISQRNEYKKSRLALEAETLGHVRQQLVGVAGGSLMGHSGWCNQNQAPKTDEYHHMDFILWLYIYIYMYINIMLYLWLIIIVWFHIIMFDSSYHQIISIISQYIYICIYIYIYIHVSCHITISKYIKYQQINIHFGVFRYGALTFAQRRGGHLDFAKCPSAMSWSW